MTLEKWIFMYIIEQITIHDTLTWNIFYICIRIGNSNYNFLYTTFFFFVINMHEYLTSFQYYTFLKNCHNL